MERNLFERIIGTYRIKMDTNSSTTANKTDISIVFSYKKAVAFRNAVMQKMHELKGITLQDSSVENSVTREKAEQDPWTADENLEGKTVYRYSPKDMALHCLYSASIFSLLVTIAGIVGFIIYVNIFSIQSFMQNVLGGAIALILLVLGSAYSLIKKFITYYDFRVYRDEKELHLRYGLIKLRSYTIPVDKITCLEIQQPVFSRIWKRYQAKVITVGVGDEEGESSNLTMALPKDMFLKQLDDLLTE